MLVPGLLLSVLVGVSLGMLGGGGSILTLPILKYVLGQEAHQAVAGSLLVVGTTSAFALIAHAKAGRVRWKTGLVFGASSMVGAFLAGRVARFIPAEILLVLFAIMMVVTAIAMIRGRKNPAKAEPRPDHELRIAKVLAEGLVVGAVTGLVGAGGGFLVVPALVLLGGLRMEVAVGTSLLVIAMKSFAGFAGHAGGVSLDMPLLVAVTGAALAGSLIGSWAAGHIREATLRRAFGWFVVAMALFVLVQELPALLSASTHG